MTLVELASLRLRSQHLGNPRAKKIVDLVGHMGALQAQDYAMSKWAVGIRLPDVTDESVQAELDKGTILRTHVLRPTWHIVSAEDIHWMMELTGNHVKKGMNFTNKALGLTPEIYLKSGAIIETALGKRGHLTREAIMEELTINQLDISSIRPAHYMMEAELNGIVCSGKMDGKKQTYALLAERAPKAMSLPRDEALTRLATIFFAGHGPATMADFGWWSGLPMKDVRIALGELGDEFERIEVGGQTYFLPADIAGRSKATQIHLLPAFDELLISYKDRTAAMALDHQPLAFTKNGIFKPTIIVNGRAVGTWTRKVQEDIVTIECHFFDSPASEWMDQLETSAQRFGAFMAKKIVLNIV